MGPAKYFWNTKSGEAIYEISLPPVKVGACPSPILRNSPPLLRRPWKQNTVKAERSTSATDTLIINKTRTDRRY